MCKLAGWTSSKDQPLSKQAADLALQAAHEVITHSEKDGFGYAQSGSTGLRAKFVQPSEFENMDSLPNLYRRAGNAASAFSTSYRTSQEGSYVNNKHMIVHGRTATCGVNLQNVHPFRRKGWTLAHNGVVNWAGQKSKDHDSVSCDSEHLLICMADHTPMLQRKEELKHITGYAAFLALNPQGKLVVAVDDKASLYAGITSKGRWIFGTTKAIVGAIADAWNAKGVQAYPIDSWTWMEFNANELSDPELSEWKHKDATSHQLGFASRSIGKTYQTYSSNYGYRSPYDRPTTILSAEQADHQRGVVQEDFTLDPDEQEIIDAQLSGIPDYMGK